MDFKVFNVNTTNIFPMVNTTTGGQLLTEYNLRSINSVLSSESVEFFAGMSVAHSLSDFYVMTSENASFFSSTQAIPANGIIVIQPGRALVNGHYVESLVPISIDMYEVNADLVSRGETPLDGKLAIGLKAVYSTEETMAGSIKPEVETADGSAEYIFEGIQVVILPWEDFILPEDTNQEIGVTAHLKLATFTLTSAGLYDVKQNYPAKCKAFDITRIGSVDDLLSDAYIKKAGLDPGKFYAMAGKGSTSSGRDAWCNIDDSLIVWDAYPHKSINEPAFTSATFITDVNDNVRLVLPHKQIDGSAGYTVTNAAGQRLYFDPVSLTLPKADYNSGTAGTVDKAYTNQIKSIATELHNIYNRAGMTQKGYIEILDDIADLPALNQEWTPGDYIIVSQDNTLEYESTTVDREPSTMYVVIPGIVNEIAYGRPGGYTTLTGTQLAYAEGFAENGDPEPSTDDPELFSTYFGDLTQYRGIKNQDFFLYNYTNENGVVVPYYYYVSAEGLREYSAPILLTSEIPVASETVVGGFLNVPDTATDYGYVYLDSDGHLRLMDYGLLRSGVLAYQLGEDFATPSGVSNAEIQNYLDEYVNQRVAFPNANQTQNAENPNVINIEVTVTESDEVEVIDIYDIDSRFNTSVYLHLYGTANENLTINISDCSRIRIENKIEGSPVINLYRSCLYYDYMILNTLSNIADLKLWYQKFESTDSNLVVDGMTVVCSSGSSVYTDYNVTGSEYWSETAPNDNHFIVALQSLTFGSDGYVTGASVLVRNNSTSNVALGKSIIHEEFELPQGPSLYYPKRRFNNQVKVTGEFIAAYQNYSPVGYIIQDTKFSLLTPCYDRYEEVVKRGDIAFLVDASLVESSDSNMIDVWDTGSFHSFSGTTLMI